MKTISGCVSKTTEGLSLLFEFFCKHENPAELTSAVAAYDRVIDIMYFYEHLCTLLETVKSFIKMCLM